MERLGSRLTGALVAANNRRFLDHAPDRSSANPREIRDEPWARRIQAEHLAIRAEWDQFATVGGPLPSISHLIDEDQGEDGVWRAGLLVSRGRPMGPLPAHFPATVKALQGLPGLWSALFSVLEPGTTLPEHCGGNAGVLRFHLGIRCSGDTALEVRGSSYPYRDGIGILFDDTEPHRAWNHGDQPRVTLFCELLRPAPGWGDRRNRLVQQALALDPRYRLAPARAAEWQAVFDA